MAGSLTAHLHITCIHLHSPRCLASPFPTSPKFGRVSSTFHKLEGMLTEQDVMASAGQTIVKLLIQNQVQGVSSELMA